MKKKDDKKTPAPAKPRLFPEEREPIPREEKRGQALLEELQRNFEKKVQEYFPDRTQISERFKIFDRDGDNLISFDEMQELMAAVNQVIPNENGVVRELYDLLAKDRERETGEEKKEEEKSNEPVKGITEDDFLLIISKKKKEEDIKAELEEAFRELCPNPDGIFNAEEFREMLMYGGFKYSEEECDAIMKEITPKKQETFRYQDFIKKITEPKKGMMMMMMA